VPTVTIIGETFRPIAKYESEGLGLPELPLAIVEYPMGGVPTEEAVQRAHRAFSQILAGLRIPAEDQGSVTS
jgi:hypothetical protein